MKLLGVIRAQAVRRATARKRLYMPDVLQVMRDRYGFVRLPQSVEEVIPGEGGSVNFAHGRFVLPERTIVIDTLQVYPQLITVDTGTSTDDSDVVLDDLLSEEVGLVAEDPNHPKMYVSQLQVHLNASLNAAMSTTPLQRMLTEFVRAYLPASQKDASWPHAFELDSFGMRIDPSTFSLPCDFRVERKVNQPYATNLYATQAPLRTSEHIAVLEELERTLGITGGGEN